MYISHYVFNMFAYKFDTFHTSNYQRKYCNWGTVRKGNKLELVLVLNPF